ncbi:Uncharacterised protein [Leclercia adecarboxylata]|uniref:ABC-type glycine betaine transport system substrate-binding domain-containing protein n=1 Tax=Leclercia adecarboxylata TaxID=83655 RepID=A0A4U9HT31_9ENTR|nr:Uncharacterised protein [Leclercia adecarboxylata]
MNNTYAFAMQRKRAEAEHINTMSELVAKVEQVRKTDPDNNWLLGLDLEFSGRSDGMKPLQPPTTWSLIARRSARWTPVWSITRCAMALSTPADLYHRRAREGF